jgi:hypothetical protein
VLETEPDHPRIIIEKKEKKMPGIDMPGLKLCIGYHIRRASFSRDLFSAISFIAGIKAGIERMVSLVCFSDASTNDAFDKKF